ncbi:hypothetical protein [Streptomyces sp. NPDC093223]|uniref:hypothetical protein n=1 Tax=Streptomyces sp. NPDC093223 TaxID=3366033 RepID=UPI0037F2BA71
MSTLTTRAGFDSFSARMRGELAALPAGPRPLHIEQAALAADAFFTHRVDDGGHHVAYDPRQIDPLSVRQFLGIHAEFTEDAATAGVRAAYYAADTAVDRARWGVVLGEIDRSQDPAGVLAACSRVLARAAGGA